VNVKSYILKAKIIEALKHDMPLLQLLFVSLFLTKALILLLRGKELEYIETLCQVHRSGWFGSEKVVIFLVKKFVLNSKGLKNKFITDIKERIVPLDNMKRFFEDPLALFDGVCLIVKSPSNHQKGVVIIKYSYYFSLMFKFFDMNEFSSRYHIVLEPSWAGTCDTGILCYTSLTEPVFVMAYENRDFNFLDALNSNLVPVKLSSNWWVNHEIFKPKAETEKDIDIVVVSGWAKFKRHQDIFKALSKVKRVLPHLKVALVGYPHDLTINDVKEIANHYNLAENLTFYEWISPMEVSALYSRSKVNLLWSRFEGLNRSIIEGMFCDIPCIIRDGFNYGQKYSYVNDHTGYWSTEDKLAEDIMYVLENRDKFSPRQYVMKNHTCIKATEILQDSINTVMSECSAECSFQGIVIKTNELHGMTYFDNQNDRRFDDDVEKIKECLTEPVIDSV
jgi:glycosyltransferase involved in cell wall biosynthesis